MDIIKVKKLINYFIPIDSMTYTVIDDKEKLLINGTNYASLVNDCINKSIDLHNEIMNNIDDDLFMELIEIIKDEVDLNKIDKLINADKLNIDESLYLVENLYNIYMILIDIVRDKISTLKEIENTIWDCYK